MGMSWWVLLAGVMTALRPCPSLLAESILDGVSGDNPPSPVRPVGPQVRSGRDVIVTPRAREGGRERAGGRQPPPDKPPSFAVHQAFPRIRSHLVTYGFGAVCAYPVTVMQDAKGQKRDQDWKATIAFQPGVENGAKQKIGVGACLMSSLFGHPSLAGAAVPVADRLTRVLLRANCEPQSGRPRRSRGFQRTNERRDVFR